MSRQISVVQTRVMVNAGDHAQDVQRVFEADEAETLGELVERLLTEEAWVGINEGFKPGNPRYDDYLTIRIAQPKDVTA